MALVVNSNISSLNAQRQLLQSGADLDKASSRLASGLRINSAADDAAGLAISNRQTSQIRGLDQAIRNANDGISLIQTAEGALQESGNILQRMRELAVQSSNGIYTDTDRATLDAEVQQLVEELDRIAETTSFNGQNLLDGSLNDVSLQVGAEAGQSISFSIDATDTSTLGLGSTSSDLSGDRISEGTSIGQGDVEINGIGLTAITNLNGGAAADTSLQDVIDDINTNVSGVTASGFNIVSADTVGTGVVAATDALRITLGDIDGGSDTNYDISNTASLDELVEKINTTTGGNVVAALDDSGKLTLSNTTGGSISIALDTTTGDGTFTAATQTDVASSALTAITGVPAGVAGNDAAGDGAATFAGSIALTSDDGSAVTITKGADGTDADLSNLGFTVVEDAGVVTGQSIGSTSQNGALVAGDVKINGVDIGVIDQDAGLAAKVTAINNVSDSTGVTASTEAIESYAANASATEVYQEIAVTGPSAIATGETLLVNGAAVTFTAAGATATQAEVVEGFNAVSDTTGVRAFLNDDDTISLSSEGNITIAAGTAAFASLGSAVVALDGGAVADGVTEVATTLVGETGSVKINGTEVALADLGDLETIVTNLNTATATTGVTAQIDDNGELELKSSSTINIEIGQTQGLASAHALGITFTDSDTDNRYSDEVITIDPRIKLDSDSGTSISVEVTADGATNTGLKNLNTDAGATVTGSAISNISVATAASAQSAIESIDTAIESISDTRSQLGAINNRLDFTVSNLGNISEKTSAARSRIVDADFAAESASLSRAQVLQQASQAMLAQANARPQQVLSLLQ